MNKPPLQMRPLEHPSHCDICGKRRNVGSHKKCSRLRQAANQWKWEK